MCTVTLVAGRDRFRMMCNRDEVHTRPPAHPPAIVRVGRGQALLPIDPRGGGTWIAANAHGLVFSTLNGEGPPGAPGLSRGRLILELMDARDLGAVVDRAHGLCGRCWPAHRVLITDGRQLLELRLRASGLTVDAYGVGAPLMFTSSSLGDAQVEPVRRGLFDALVTTAADRLDGQDAFHRHRWQDRPHLSVHMRRHDAATQSVTTVDVFPDAVTMRYESTTELAGRPAQLAIGRAAVVPIHRTETAIAGVAHARTLVAAAS